MLKEIDGQKVSNQLGCLRRLVCIGCSKTKRDVAPNPKRGNRVTPVEFYGGQLFPLRVQYAESRGLPWVVLSAKYGVWRPDVEQKTYDLRLDDLHPADFAAWHASVAYSLVHELWEPWEADIEQPVLRPRQLTVELHAGEEYCEPLGSILRSLGVVVERPCEGLGIGKQLKAYTTGALRPPERVNRDIDVAAFQTGVT